jgi:hypothetical protein
MTSKIIQGAIIGAVINSLPKNNSLRIITEAAIKQQTAMEEEQLCLLREKQLADSFNMTVEEFRLFQRLSIPFRRLADLK